MLTNDDFTTDPIEGEVHAALGRYKMALIRTGHRGVWHRFMCWTGDKEALSLKAELDEAERHAKAVISKSTAHRAVLETIVKQQPESVARKDNLLSLLSETIEI